MDQLAQLAPLLLILAAFWFLVIRPTRKRQRQMSQLQAAVDVGVHVMLSSGIYGEVRSLGEETVQVSIAPGTEVKVSRQAIVKVLDDEQVAEQRPGQDTAPETAPGEEPGPTAAGEHQ